MASAGLRALVELSEGARRVLLTSAAVKAAETVLVVGDVGSLSIGRALFDAAEGLGADAVLALIRAPSSSPAEPPALIANAMLESDVVVLATSASMTHTHARRAANRSGARVVSIPGVTEEMLREGALTADHGEILQVMRRVARRLRHAREVRLASASGTDLRFSVEGRAWNETDTGVCAKRGEMTTLPAGEVFVAPVEGTAEGRLAVDLWFEEPLGEVATVVVKGGLAAKVVGADRAVAAMNVGGRDGRNVGKFGIGMNPRARRSGPPHELEKALGTAHVGFGDSAPFGGRVECGVRVDALVGDVSVEVDGSLVVDKGRLAS